MAHPGLPLESPLLLHTCTNFTVHKEIASTPRIEYFSFCSEVTVASVTLTIIARNCVWRRNISVDFSVTASTSVCKHITFSAGVSAAIVTDRHTLRWNTLGKMQWKIARYSLFYFKKLFFSNGDYNDYYNFVEDIIAFLWTSRNYSFDVQRAEILPNKCEF